MRIQYVIYLIRQFQQCTTINNVNLASNFIYIVIYCFIFRDQCIFYLVCSNVVDGFNSTYIDLIG